ncbi:MAG: hypothetical protein JXB33_11040 [Clostridia bacterium]|nr:hypothetical protein [Clostridia bacterium]
MNEKEKKTGFRKFLDENRSLVFTIPVFIVLVIVVVLVYLLGGNNSDVSESTQPTATPAESAAPVASGQPGGTEVSTLPIDERDKDQSEILRNPFADPYKVSGIIYDKNGGSIAIIEAENKSFIVSEGYEAEGYFKVLDIESNKVTLEVDGIELVLYVSVN